jgi:hypothetical protein
VTWFVPFHLVAETASFGLDGLKTGSWQLPARNEWGPSTQNGNWHTPPEQVSPPAQTLPHAPQFSVSKARLVHTPLHLVRPGAHGSSPRMHTPPLQYGVDASQTLPQAPQLSGSE